MEEHTHQYNPKEKWEEVLPNGRIVSVMACTVKGCEHELRQEEL